MFKVKDYFLCLEMSLLESPSSVVGKCVQNISRLIDHLIYHMISKAIIFYSYILSLTDEQEAPWHHQEQASGSQGSPTKD